MHIIKRQLLILFMMLQFSCGFAQSVRLFQSGKDLSNSLVNKIYQDSRQFIWVATEDGLNRLDGNDITIFRHDKDDSLSLDDSFVCDIFEDSYERIWIGSSACIQWFDRSTEKFTKVPFYVDNQPRNFRVSDFMETHSREVWIASTTYGLFSMKPGQTHPVQRLTDTLPSRTVMCLHEDSKGNIWIGLSSNGVGIYNPTTKLFRHLGLNTVNASFICSDSGGNIFIASRSGGLFIYDSLRDLFTTIPYVNQKLSGTSLPIRSLLCDHQDNIWVGTDGKGLKKYNRSLGVLEDYNDYSANLDLSTAKVHSIYEDRQNNLWLGLFQQGVCVAKNKPDGFTYYGNISHKYDIIGEHSVMSLSHSANNVLWVGMDTDGLYAIDNNGKLLAHYIPDEYCQKFPNTILSIHQDQRDQQMWIGAYSYGIGLLNPQTGQFSYKNEIFQRHNPPTVAVIQEDKNHNLWIGTWGAGIYKKSPDAKYASQIRFPNNSIHSIALTDSLAWVGSFRGLFTYNLQTAEIKEYLPYTIYCLLKASDQRIWAGTSEGLGYYDHNTGRFIMYSTKDGLPSNVICGLAEDQTGNIWISTHNGISKLSIQTTTFENFSTTDGLQATEYSRRAYSQNTEGDIFFGNIQGVTRLCPEQITDDAPPHEVFIASFSTLSEQELTQAPTIDRTKFRVNFKQNMIVLGFTAFEFINPERIIYQYKVLPLNKSWVSLPRGSSHLSLSNLHHGNYTLSIRCGNNNHWSDPKVYELHVIPPWYLSWWAKMLFFLILGSILYGVVYFIYYRFRERNELARQENVIRQNEARLQTIINICHDIRTPISLIINPLEKLLKENNGTKKQAILALMYRNAQRILRLISQLLDVQKIDKGQLVLKFRETNMVSFVDDIIQTFESTSEQNDITVTYRHSQEQLPVWVDLNNFDKVLMNIFSNAFKFTPEHGHIQVDLSTNGQNMVLSISDSGEGIATTDINRIFERFYQSSQNSRTKNAGTGIGLHLSYSLMQLLHGTITAKNNEDAPGACFTITLPLGSSHLSTAEIDIEQAPIGVTNAYRPDNIPDDSSIYNINTPKTHFTIMIVDDEPDVRQYLHLELGGKYHILECENGKEAFATILATPPDLVISDIVMPQMDGINLCKKIRSNTNTCHIPVILLSGKSKNEDISRGTATGADAYIVKPFNTEVLRNTVQSILENRKILKMKYLSKKQAQEDDSNNTQKTVNDLFVDKITAAIEERISDPNLNVETLADYMNMSRAHLYRKLKETSNCSAGSLIKSIRLNRASELLKDKNLQISEIAYSLGFSSVSHFSWSFKEYYGISPTGYQAKER